MQESPLPRPTLSAPELDEFRRVGVLGPYPILDDDQRASVVAHFEQENLPSPMTWWKGHGASDAFVFDIATRTGILARVIDLLGPNVVLWGAQFVRRAPGQEHAWHSDIETVAAPLKFVSAWIGIENTSTRSGLKFIGGTFAPNTSVQQVASERGVRREGMSDDLALSLAEDYSTHPVIVHPAVRDGEALLFAGGIWHASLNTDDHVRSALLLQYTTPDVPLFVLDHTQLDWPFGFTGTAVPCVLVAGDGHDSPQDIRDRPVAN